MWKWQTWNTVSEEAIAVLILVFLLSIEAFSTSTSTCKNAGVEPQYQYQHYSKCASLVSFRRVCRCSYGHNRHRPRQNGWWGQTAFHPLSAVSLFHLHTNTRAEVGSVKPPKSEKKTSVWLRRTRALLSPYCVPPFLFQGCSLTLPLLHFKDK